MLRKQSVIEVKILLDPIPGWGDNAEDHVKLLQKQLNSLIPHYKPIVKLVKINEVETIYNIETRELNIIEDHKNG